MNHSSQRRDEKNISRKAEDDMETQRPNRQHKGEEEARSEHPQARVRLSDGRRVREKKKNI